MFFNKNKEGKKCENCGAGNQDSFNFCPNCGNNFLDMQKENFGLLGRNDSIDGEIENQSPFANMGFTDKMFNSIFNTLVKNLDKQMRNQMRNFEEDPHAEVKAFPNGIKIKISGPMPVQKKKPSNVFHRSIDEAQIKKMNSLPRAKAKTSVKRLGNKLVYELNTPGIASTEDVFVSKLESGYEIKVIGNKKVYVNNFPINLPLRKYSVEQDKLLIEFAADD